ncbi:MAG TPA: enoyl-CoA hydratase/isomerase family protein [Sneathiellales bacterium]|nr:enoyl-CoA hydratase/isomerase family protein [Sneathiellales bacterium]
MSAASDHFRPSIDGDCATITLNRPERHNSLDPADLAELRRLLDQVEGQPAVRVLVITGAGEKTFCAGFALDQIADQDWKDRPFERAVERLEQVSVPTICALNGGVYGGGVELALACDFRIGVDGMNMFVPPARLGIHYPTSGLQRYVQRLGLNVAKRILVACEKFDAQELLRIGFVDALVPADGLTDRVSEWGTRIAALAPLSVQGMKQTLNEIARGTLQPEEAAARIEACWRSNDHQEGIAARAEKRNPQFTGT